MYVWVGPIIYVLGRTHYMLNACYQAGLDGYPVRPDVCMVCGILCNSLNFFVLTVLIYGFKYLCFQKEGPDLIALHPLEIYFALNVYKLL